MLFSCYCVSVWLTVVSEFSPAEAVPASCWQFFTSTSDFMLVGSEVVKPVGHSEYYYGHCNDLEKVFYAHIHLDHMDVLGKPIVRGWLDLYRIPTCILLRGTSFEELTIQSSAYNFQLCVPRITYCHSKQRFKYYYYEWYIPLEMTGGMNWDMYFFGPAKANW